jgi:fructose-1,6-bisphosphatase/inositol monophosphatase family enzyme
MDAGTCPQPPQERERPLLPETLVLAGRQEVRYRDLPPLAPGTRVAGVGSVAYRLALLARGTGQAVTTGYGRSEWDVAAGVALCRAAGLRATGVLGDPLRFNQPEPHVRGLLVAAPALHREMLAYIRRHVSEG